jgi:hypothetical protein
MRNHKELNLRSASDFAQQLNVHVNHLNRAVKESLRENHVTNYCRAYCTGIKNPVET